MANALVIMLDDMHRDLARYMPFTNGTVRRAGTEFTRMYCNVPVCQPARVGYMSGQWAQGSENGVYQNNDAWTSSGVTGEIQHRLQAAGVTTGGFGKFTNQTTYGVNTTGWDERCFCTTDAQSGYGYTVFHDPLTSEVITSTHQLTYMADKVETFVTSADEPWYCYWAPTIPHISDLAGGNTPFPATHKMFSWLNWEPTLLTDITDKPSWIQSMAQKSAANISVIRRTVRQQVRELYDFDQVFKTIYNQLDLDDTTVIVVADGGVFLGEHREMGLNLGSSKDAPYEVAARVFAVAVGPDFSANTVNDTPVCLQDITATMHEIFGSTPTLSQDGISLINIDLPDRGILYERSGAASAERPDAQGIFKRNVKLIHYPGEAGDDEWEAYEIDTDPDEFLNVANDPGFAVERAGLEAELDALIGTDPPAVADVVTETIVMTSAEDPITFTNVSTAGTVHVLVLCGNSDGWLPFPAPSPDWTEIVENTMITNAIPPIGYQVFVRAVDATNDFELIPLSYSPAIESASVGVLLTLEHASNNFASWVVGDDEGGWRAVSGTSTTNVAQGITTTEDDMLVLTVSVETTPGSDEDAPSSVSGLSTLEAWGDGDGVFAERDFTIAVYSLLVESPTTTADVTVTYPSSNTTSGMAVQIGIPSP